MPEKPDITLIKLHDVAKVYGTEANPIYALRGISLEIFQGEYLSSVPSLQ